MRIMRLPGLLLSALLSVLCPTVEAQAGLFDFLLPSSPEPQRAIERPVPMDLPPLQGAPIDVHHAVAHRQITVIRKTPADKMPAVGRQSAALKKDPTLRDGDAIMTTSGIRIFASSAASSSHEHGATDFVTLRETKGLSAEEQAALAEIDAHRSEEGWQSKSTGEEQLLTGRSVASNTAHAWKWLRDPKGHVIRYVGP